jgi:integrase
MAKHLLTDLHVRNAKPRGKPYRLFDGDGLALWVSPTGARSWQLRYKLRGREQTATLGKLDGLTLKDARERADEQRKLAAAGEHLTTVKRVRKLQRRADVANTFAAVSTAWITRQARREQWTADYRAEVAASLRNHLSALDSIPMTNLTLPLIAPLLEAVERKAPRMIEKVRPRLNALLDYAVEQGILSGNPLPAERRRKMRKVRNYPAVTDLAGIGRILRAARASDPCKGIQRAHLLLAFTALRPGEVVAASWNEFALDGVDVPIGNGHRTKLAPAAGNWAVARARMKRKDQERGPHVVPLPPALLAALREWREADDRDAVFVCPAPRDAAKPVTIEAIEKFYRRTLNLAGKHSPHSWRAAFSTVCREAGKDGDAVESQLDHVVGSKVSSAYDRSKRLELRRELLTWYEMTLIATRDGAKVVRLKSRRPNS